MCTLAVLDVPAGENGFVLFAVTIDDPAGTTVIRNAVIISFAEGPEAGDETTHLLPAPAPLLDTWGFAALLALLTAVAWAGLRRRRETCSAPRVR